MEANGFMNIQLFGQPSLSIQLQTDPTAVDTLAESWGKVIENFSKSTISSLLKNTDLSGDPKAGVINAKRFANATANPYGTARASGSGSKVKAKPVPVPISDHDEFIEEVEEADLAMYGVTGLIQRRTSNQDSAMKRLYERRFFKVAADGGSIHTFTGSTIQAKLSEMIRAVETVKNEFVDGVDRANIALILDTSTYDLARDYIDTLKNANINSAVGEFGVFHGVMVFSTVYLPDTVNYLVMAKGSVAQPIRQSLYSPKKIELSDATAFGAFLYSGTTNVTPDLVFIAGALGEVKATSAEGSAGTKTVISIQSSLSDSSHDFYYLTGASAVTAPVYGADVGETWTKMTLTEGAQELTTGTDAKIRIAEADSNGRILKVSDEIDVVYG